MGKIFHIDKYGVPAICNSPNYCPYGKDRHFKNYDDAKLYVEEEIINNKSDLSHPSRLIESYFDSLSALNEFPINKKVAELEDFDLMTVSWMMKPKVKMDMKVNKIANIRFSYGDIVRVINEKIKRITGSPIDIDRYYNVTHRDNWSPEMKTQYEHYNGRCHEIAEFLDKESAELIVLPMDARKRLSIDGYMNAPDNIHEVVYKVKPEVSPLGNMVSYNYSTGKISKEFDIYELAGVIEGKTLHDLCYSENYDSQFQNLWEKHQREPSVNFDYAVKRFKEEQFMQGIEGTDVPKAFVQMSPIVAQELARFIRMYRAMMDEVRNILVSNNLDFIGTYYNDDGEWMVD